MSNPNSEHNEKEDAATTAMVTAPNDVQKAFYNFNTTLARFDAIAAMVEGGAE